MGSVVRSDQVERRLKLRELRILLAVVKAGSMAKGAADLAISQPNVSKAIADLEQAFGVRLLDRSPRGVEPTTYGRAVIKRGTAVFDELRHAVKDVAFLADPTSGELRLGCIDWAAGIVGVAIDRMSRQYPRITFDVMSAGDGATLLRELRSRNIELFVAVPDDSLSREDCDTEILYDDPLVVVADALHPLVRRRGIALAELVNEAWAMPPANTVSGAYIRDVFRKNDLAVPDTIVSTYSHTLRHYLVATARFITVLPKPMFELMAKSLSIKALPVHLPPTQRKMAIVVLKARTLSPIAQLFTETVRAVAKPQTKVKAKVKDVAS
jgi:DNA-binding transcriptional LysR family regulator